MGTDEMRNVNEMFSDYENQNNEDGKVKKFDNILTKFFKPKNNKELFRLLPPNKNEKIVEVAYFHEMKITNGRGENIFKKFYCPKHNGDTEFKLDANGEKILDMQGNPVKVAARCPICEKAEQIKATQDNSLTGLDPKNFTPQQKDIYEKNKEIFKQFKAIEVKKFYILAGIDRMAERDGKKFWRIKDSYQKKGILDKLMPVLSDFYESKKADFTSPINGADLSITVVDASTPSGWKYRDVSAITIKDQSPLHTDKNVEEYFLKDDTSWRDVYKATVAPNVNNYDFLVMAMNNQMPYWDDSDPRNKHWVFPGRPDLEEKAKQRNSDFQRNQQSENSNINAINDMYSGNTNNSQPKNEYVDMTTQNPTVVENERFESNSVNTMSFDDELPF